MFRKYPKIYSFEKEECVGILDGTVYIEEKLDGAQTSVWLQDGKLRMGSRNTNVTDEPFRGFTDYVKEFSDGFFQDFLNENPSYILYGEWLVPHTVTYKKEFYHKFYLYDIFCIETESYVLPGKFPDGVLRPPFLALLENPTIEDVRGYIGKSNFSDNAGEGIVIKNYEFTNKFGDACHSKMVVDGFQEVSKLERLKLNEGNIEQDCCNLYVTKARVRKIMHKIDGDEMHAMEYRVRVLQSIYHDILTEEITNIAKKCRCKFDFRLFSRLVNEWSIPIIDCLIKLHQK